MHTVTRLCSLLLASHLSFPASAACSDFSSHDCRLEALLQADRDLNALYSRALGSRSESERGSLQAAQRKWLKDRNKSCSLGSLGHHSEWIEVVARDDTKFNCIYATTRARLDELRQVPMKTIEDLPPLLKRRETTFPVSHSSGKWYAEISFLPRPYTAEEEKEYVQIAVTDGKSAAGTQLMRRELGRLADADGEYVMSLAIDLDNRMVYWAENGKWKNGAPGSSTGMPLNPGNRYSFRVLSTGRSISEDLLLGFLHINTGRAPFRYATPAAYQAFYAPPANAEARPLDWIVPSYASVAGKTLTAWTERYWAWLMPQMSVRNPADDLTGEQCAAQQSGPVWFLAGGDVKARITRRCTIPQGKYILVPALAQIITAGPAAEMSMPCSKLESDDVASNASRTIQSDFLVLDGQRFDALYDYRPYTPVCRTIRNDSGETVVKDVVFYGTYVLLQPLPPGDHTISFGGELPASNTYRGVTYQLRVE